MKGSGTKVAASTMNEIATSEKMTDGFMTPNKKHIASFAALATLMLGEVTRTKDGRSKNLTRTRNVPPKCNKQVTSKQQTRSFLTSIN
jgi:hypothetical protein